ncbi:MAG TPA: TonB-dependent receptor [Bryobacteraceae bacterium]|nr:TonB-dependent receptor [Bryobacteraceae bacterium]
MKHVLSPSQLVVPRWWGWIALVALFASSPVIAQLLQGTINGNVTDVSHAVVAGAAVSAKNQNTGFTRGTTTNASGEYSLPDIPPGSYSVTVSSPGFQTYTQSGVMVTVQAVTRADVSLTVGQVNQNVLVSAQAENLQTDQADVRSEIGGQLLSNLPVPVGRNYQMLFTTIPGASPPQNSHSFGANATRALAFTVNGGNVNANITLIDGAGTRNFSASDVIQYIPALDAIETVSVATSSFDADQSSGGGFVNVTVKSGTNAVHGSLFEDHSDQHLQAYAWVANRTAPKLPYIHNQFGGAIGGPIKKDKVFYFVSYQGTRLVQGNAVQAEVPTAAMKAGNLSSSPTSIYDPLTGNSNGTGRTAFAGNIIPASRINPGVEAMIGTGDWPNPNQAGTGSFGLGNDFLCSGCQGNSGARNDQLDSKVSWNPTSKLSTFVRFGFNNGDWYDPQIFGLLGGPTVSPTNGAVGFGGANVYNGTLSATYVFSPSLFAAAFFGYSRDDMHSNQPYQNQNLGWTLLGIPGLDTASLAPNKQLQQGGMPLLAIDNFASLGPANTYQPQNYSDPEKNFSANIGSIKGAHTIRAGFDSDFQDSNEMQYQTAGSSYISNAGGFHFAQGTTQLLGGKSGNDFNSFASLLLGMPQDSGKIYQFPNEYYTRNRSYGIYVADHWQLTPKLTVTYGIRWDDYPFPKRLGTGLEFYNPQSATMSICGLGSVPGNCGITRDRQRFNPRFGVAYRLTNSTVIRAGYSSATDPILFLGYTLSGRLNYPYLYGQLLLPPNSYSYATTLSQGLPVVSAPNISSGTVPVPGLAAVTTYNNANYVRDYIQTWNFTVEQQVKGWLASAGYVGMRDIDPQDNLQMNWSPVNGGTAGEVLNQLTGRTASTLFLGTMGTNTYDSLQTRLQRHFGGAYQLGMTYTFSKALGYAISPQVVIPQDYGLNYGPQSTDITHMFSATAVADLPFGKGKHWAQTGVASKLAGGWQISTVVTAHSGFPFTATASSATLNAPFSGQFANCISAPQQTGNIFNWYQRSAFAVPGSGTFGTCGTDNLWGPGLFNVDLAVNRAFRISEKFRLHFRAEMQNVGNTPHFVMPSGNTSVNSSTFMEANSIANTGTDGVEQRAVQLSLRLNW